MLKRNLMEKKISENIVISSYFEEFSNAKNFGERIDVFKTDILKCFLYPVASNIKFIPEIWFYVQISHAGYKFAYIPEPLRLFFDDATENRLSKSSLLKHAEGHYISRATMLKLIPIYVYFGNVMAWVKTIIRFGQCAHYLNKSFMQRKQDTNIIYAIFSYFSRFIKVGI